MGRFTRQITASIKADNNKNDMTIIILSAGIGGRIKSNEPRSLIKIGTKTLIEHQIELLRLCGIDDILVVTGYLHEKIEKVVGEKVRYKYYEKYKNTNSGECCRSFRGRERGRRAQKREEEIRRGKKERRRGS